MTIYRPSDLPPFLAEGLRHPLSEAAALSQADIPSHRSTKSVEGFVDSISLDEALLLYGRVRELRPEATLEIGMFTAASTIAILAALEANGVGEHYACDPFQDTYCQNAGLRNVHRSGLGGRLHFANEFPEAAGEGWPIAGFALIDGSHLFDLTILDFVVVDKHLRVGGVVALHDLWMPSLRKVVRWVTTNRGYECVWNEPYSPKRRERCESGLGAVLRRLPKAERVWAPELLVPWHEVVPPHQRMVFLRKTREDDRDWRDHRVF